MVTIASYATLLTTLPADSVISSTKSSATSYPRMKNTPSATSFIIRSENSDAIAKDELLSLIKKEFKTLYIAFLYEDAFDRNPAYVDSMIEALADYDQDITAVH
jgi:hypothetical protein